ncbi:MAG: MogA/MoaB family molybdenum cofactor biosynthesis protein [candidate division Zixibacteria bacterium]|nr:MogA/MoaB family molybdenum cofactor biosynthesis protein [candidate division Zixibacteria bacterium]
MTNATPPQFTAQVITVSTRCAAGETEDRSGPLAVSQMIDLGLTTNRALVIPDNRLKIAQSILRYCDCEPVSLLIFTGGTGPTPDDLTPDAIVPLLDRRYLGIEEAIQTDGRNSNPKAPLSRIVAGARGRTVVIAVPGSPGGVKDALTTMRPFLQHLLTLTRGSQDPH